jgi:hypothetical protein
LNLHHEGHPPESFARWAHDLIGIGRTFAAIVTTAPVTLAISLPVLDFAASLCAAGFVAERAKQQLEGRAASLSDADRQRLFRQLCALKHGSPVHFRRSSSGMVRARFAGVTEYHGKQYGIIQFQDRAAGAGREFVGPSKVDRVFFAFDDASSSTEAEEQALGKKIRLNIGLARAFVADPFILTQMLLRSGIDCAIIGVIRAISCELIEVTLSGAAEVGALCIVGRLQDVVRAGRFVNSGECAHSEIFAPRSKTIAKCAPKLVIFRGAAAYVHQADTFQNAHHLALLSPIEQNFEEGVAALNDRFLNRSAKSFEFEFTLPRGALAMGFCRTGAIA